VSAMISAPPRIRIVAAAAFAAALLISAPLSAQRAGGDSGQGQGQEAPLSIGYEISQKFQEANMCMEEEDYECAIKALDDAAKRDLNPYEEATLWNLRAYMYYQRDDDEKALDAYKHIVALPREDLPPALIQQSLKNLAVLYIGQEQYDLGLSTYQEYMALPSVTPSEGDYELLAQIYYQINNYADGETAIRQAIKLANDKGELGKENWYTLLYFFQYQLEEQEGAIDTLTTLVQNWTKWSNMRSLAGELSERDRTDDTLTLYETAYDMGWLKKSSELVSLANLYLTAEMPFQAASVLQKGLDDGIIDSTEQNWRLLAQAWQLAEEHKKALPALNKASELADDGEIDRLVTESMVRLARWDDCVDAAHKALDRGVDREDVVNLRLGTCLINTAPSLDSVDARIKRYQEARAAFEAAAKDDRQANAAQSFLNYVDDRIQSERRNAELLAQVKRGAGI
jgi:tetratricopeptide (TPR) repeat protein